jgi:hypothetical protein
LHRPRWRHGDLTTNMTRVDIVSRLRQALLDLKVQQEMAASSPPARPFGHVSELYATSVLPRHRRDKSELFGSKNAPFCCQPRRQTAKPNSHTSATSTARLFAADKVLYRRQRREPNRAFNPFGLALLPCSLHGAATARRMPQESTRHHLRTVACPHRHRC